MISLPISLRMLFHCDFYAFLTNLGDNDRAGLCGEGCCAVDGGDGAEHLAIDAIEADLLVVFEAGDVDKTTGRLDSDATHRDVVDAGTFNRA